MSFTKIDSATLNSRGATSLDNKPQISATALKTEFDAPAKQVVAPAVNNLVDELEATSAAASLGALSPTGRTAGNTVQSVLNKLSSDLASVEQTSGQTSHTHLNKEQLDLIGESGEGNLTYNNKVIPFKDEVVSLDGYVPYSEADKALVYSAVQDADYVHTDNNYTDLEKALVLGAVQDTAYVHTDNNYTTAEKDKLDGIEEGANNYELPIATASQLGGIKPDGTTTEVGADGKLHVIGGTGGSEVTWTQAVTTGTKIAEINIDGNVTDVYAPTSGGGGGTSSYPALDDKPKINGNELIGDKTSNQLGLADKAHTHLKEEITDLTEVTKATVSDWGFYEKPSSGIAKTDLAADVQTSLDNADTAYQKPSSGIPETDLATAVKEKLTKIPSANGTKDQVLMSNGDGTSNWEDAPSGGHEMVDEVADVLSAEKSENKVVNAFTMADFANVYTECILTKLESGKNTIGTWWEEGETWITDAEHMIVSPSLVEHDGEQIHLEMPEFWVGDEMTLADGNKLYANTTPLHMSGYQWDSVHGALTIKCGETAPNDISVVVKITHIRERS